MTYPELSLQRIARALDTCRRIVEAGLIMNIDLMYGLPGQRHEDFARDFAMVAAQGVHAITAYNLRLNEMTSVQRQLADHERFDLAGLMAWREFVRALVSGAHPVPQQQQAQHLHGTGGSRQ